MIFTVRKTGGGGSCRSKYDAFSRIFLDIRPKKWKGRVTPIVVLSLFETLYCTRMSEFLQHFKYIFLFLF
jgi:hypothetical protein